MMDLDFDIKRDTNSSSCAVKGRLAINPNQLQGINKNGRAA